jgi:hypothetical protein
MDKRHRSVEGSSTCSAPAETVWEVWTNPSEWPGDVIEAGSVDGDFAVGSKVTVKVKGGVKTTSTLTRVEPPRIWSSVSKFPEPLSNKFERCGQFKGRLFVDPELKVGALCGPHGQPAAAQQEAARDLIRTYDSS